MATPPDTRPSTPGTPMASTIRDVFDFDERLFAAAGEMDKQTTPASNNKQELFVFQWLASVERELKRCGHDIFRIMQPNLERQLLKLISMPAPKPRHPIRRLIARCFLSLYVRGNSSTLFETVQILQSLIEAGKGMGDKDVKLAAIHCIGVIMETIGEKILSLVPDLTTSLLKVIKTEKIYPLIMRVEAMVALRKMLQGAGRGATDMTTKEILKVLKLTVLDKALIVRSSSADCLTALVKHTPVTFSKSELEASITLFVKAMDDSTYAIRRSVATLVATLLYSKFQGEENLTMAGAESPPASGRQGGAAGGVSAPHEVFTLDVNELLVHLSTAYNRPNTSREVRAGLSETYAALFIMLGPSTVEKHYGTIVKHLLVELASNPKNTVSRFEILTAREHVEYLLRGVIGARLLSESGQITCIRELTGSWLKTWPAVMPGDVEPSEYALICALNETSALLLDLGGAASSIQDILMSALTNLVSHPSKAVQIAAAWCLRCLCISLPTNLAKLIQTLSAKLSTDLGTLSNNGANFSDVSTRAQGLAYSVGALITVISVHPLYVSFEMSARIFSMGAQLIKNSANKDLRVAAAQIQIAWILIGALMCLGPNFVKMHLPQLLLLWKNALPKFTTKDASSSATRTELDWAFMIHVRECALGSVASFLFHNSDKLVTVDVSKRVAALLSNTLAFAANVPTSFPAQPPSAPKIQHELLNIKFSERDDALRKRIFECFVAMRHASAYEIYHPILIKAALDVFSDPDRTSGTAVTNAVSAATFSTVWAVDDGYGYGVTGKIQGLRCDVAARTSGRQEEILDGRDYDSATRITETLLKKPVLGAPEHDPLVVYTTFALPTSISRYSLPKPRPVATGVIDAAIELFSILLPLQSSALQGSLMDDLSKMLKNSTLDKNPGRKMAIQVNSVVALLGATKYAMSENKRTEHRAFEGPLASSLSQSILRDSIVHSDPYIRFVACEALGRLTSVLGSLTVSNQIKYLMEQVVANRDPDARAGYALALGNVFSHLGGMMAGGHLRSIVEYLTSLSRDPHPIVHKWSLHSLALTVSSAGLMFSPYVSSTLTNVATVYLAESHEPAGAGSIATANIAVQSELSVYHELGRIIYGLIGVLGPELQSSAKVRDLCVSLVEELRNEDDEFVIVQGIRCTQHLIMFAPLLVDMSTLVPFLQARLRRSTGLSLKKAAMTCMYQLVQRDVKSVFQHSMGGLDDQFFKLLDTDPTLMDVKDVVRSWITQTALEQPSQWIEICRKVLSRTAIDEGQDIVKNAEAQAGSGNNSGGRTEGDDYDQGDEEDDQNIFDDISKPTKPSQSAGTPTQSTSAAPTVPEPAPVVAERAVKVAPALPPRWRTRIFALECIRQVIEVVATSGIQDHFNLSVARRKNKNFGADFLVLKVADLIKMTVYAASTPIQEIRMEGLLLLRQTIERFKSTLDPEVPDSVLLEQYQAQIGAALTPAFTAESTPEVVSLGVKVCAVYVGSGIIQEVVRFGRVLKLLIGALEKCKDDKRLTAVGDVTDLTPHASQMIKWAVLNAWAELQVASVHRQYLVDVLKPNLEELCKLWAYALEEYARSRIESEVAAAASAAVASGSGVAPTTTIVTSSSGLFDATYADSEKDTEKNFDQSSTIKILGAVSALVDQKNDFMIQALKRITSPEVILTVEESEATTQNNTKDEAKESPSLEDVDGEAASKSGSDLVVDAKKVKTEGPHLLIHVIYGLCLEILAKTSSTGSQQSSANLLGSAATDDALQGCLVALHSILNPDFIQPSFLSKVFLEMMTILERVAWMEGSRVQGLVVDVISKVIQGYGSELLFSDQEVEPGKELDSRDEIAGSPTSSEPTLNDVDNPPSSSSLPGSRLRAILQLLVELYIQKCSSANVKAAKTMNMGRPMPKKTTPETIELLDRVTDILAVLVKVAPPQYQLHLSAVTLNVLVGVLRDPAFQTELDGKVLVNIKSVMEALNKNSLSLDPKLLELVLNGAIGALLKNQAEYAPGKGPLAGSELETSSSGGFEILDSMVARKPSVDSEIDVSPVEMAEWCNGLLGMMLILTNCTHVAIQQKFLDRFERLVISSIESNNAKIVTVGYQCLKSIILIENSTTVCSDNIGRIRARLFMRQLIPFVVTTIVVKAAQESSPTAGSKDDKVGMQVLEEGIQTLKSLAAASSDDARAGIVSIILSTVVPLLADVSSSPTVVSPSTSNKVSAVHTLGLNHLLSLGTQFPAEFRQGLKQLSVERRTRLETAIRASVLQQQEQHQRQMEREEQERQRQARERDRVKIQLKSNFDGFK